MTVFISKNTTNITKEDLDIMSVEELDTLKRVATRLKTQLLVGKRTTLNAMVTFKTYTIIHNCIVKRDIVKSVANLEVLIAKLDERLR